MYRRRPGGSSNRNFRSTGNPESMNREGAFVRRIFAAGGRATRDTCCKVYSACKIHRGGNLLEKEFQSLGWGMELHFLNSNFPHAEVINPFAAATSPLRGFPIESNCSVFGKVLEYNLKRIMYSILISDIHDGRNIRYSMMYFHPLFSF